MTRADLAGMEERIILAIAAVGDQIVDAIRATSAEHKAHREAMMEQGAGLLRAALDDATPRAVVIDPPAANDTPTTPPGGPANDHDAPPSTRPRGRR